MEPYWINFKNKYVYEWFSTVLHLILILTLKCVRLFMFIICDIMFFFFFFGGKGGIGSLNP